MLLSLHLALPTVPAWADGVDADGRTVYLVGRHQLEAVGSGKDAITAVLAALRDGHVPQGVLAVGYAPAASAAWAEVVMGESEQVLVDGPRASGKTQVEPALLAGKAERHARAGYALPFREAWLHSALVNADAKTRPSLQQAHWGGCWSFRDDGRMAVLTVGGVELVHALMVGTQDQAAQERARVEVHGVTAEEVIPSLDESGGIDERVFDLARNSARLPTVRRVAVAVTNPGDTDTWPYRRWIEGGGRPGCVRCEVPGVDRLTPAEVARQIADFEGSPDLQARLGRGEWAALRLGERVAEGWDATLHVAPARMEPRPDHVLAVGWDGGFSPSAVIGQLIGGQVRIYAALNDVKVGVLELIQDQVRPWLAQHAPWALDDARSLVHIPDPSMDTGSEATVRASAVRTIRDTLGGRVVVMDALRAWSPRREAVLRVLAPRHEGGMVPLAINPTEDTRLLRQAFGARWIYPQSADGRVDRSRPKKPNSPHADIGDAAAYLLAWLRPGTARDTHDRAPHAPYIGKHRFNPLGPSLASRPPRHPLDPYRHLFPPKGDPHERAASVSPRRSRFEP
jgi:hypothetical protein